MKPNQRLAAFFVLGFLSTALPTTTHASLWIPEGLNVAWLGYYGESRIVADGAGGAYMVYVYDYGASGDIDLVRRDSDGNVIWWRTVTNAADWQYGIDICRDFGGGGVFIVWNDYRGGLGDIYGSRYLPDGSLAPGWIANGTAICNQAAHQFAPKCAWSGNGVFVAWHDWRNGDSHTYAIQLTNFATVAFGWSSNGNVVSEASYQQSVELIADGTSGMIAVWQDFRSGGGDLYAQRMTATGFPLWTTGGVPVTTAINDQLVHRIAPDGTGGVIAVWGDNRDATPKVFAQRLNANGGAVWAADGLQISASFFNANNPSIVSDGFGGAMIVNHEATFNLSCFCISDDIFARRIDPFGNVIWSAVIAGNGATQVDAKITSDGAGGYVIAWADNRSGDYDIYAQRLDNNFVGRWTGDGAIASGYDYDERTPDVVADASGTAILSWQIDAGGDYYLLAQRLDGLHGHYGHPDPVILSAADTPGDQGGRVMLTWKASDRDVQPNQIISHYTIWREAPPAMVATLAASNDAPFVDPSDIGLEFKGEAYRRVTIGATSTTWEYIATVPSRYATQYSYNTPTLQDWTISDPADETYQVLAHTTNQFVFYESGTKTAHSIDNLAPAAPLALSAARVGNNVQLNWQAALDEEPDFRDYAVYRATAAGVQPTPAFFIQSSGSESYLDVSPGTGALYYIVTAVDVHDNQSTPSNEASVTVPTAVDTPSLPRELTLLGNSPNPFQSETVFRVGAPAASAARIEVYDVAGRRVRSVETPLSRGWQSVRFDGRDNAGNALASGVYFYRVQAGGKTVTKKMVIAR